LPLTLYDFDHSSARAGAAVAAIEISIAASPGANHIDRFMRVSIQDGKH